MFIFMRMACREGRQDSHCQSVLIKTADVISIFSPSRVLMTREKILYPIKTMRGEPPRHMKYFYIYVHLKGTNAYSKYPFILPFAYANAAMIQKIRGTNKLCWVY